MKTLYILFTSAFLFSVLLSYGQAKWLDSSFGKDGIVNSTIKSANDYGQGVALQSDGKIIVVGNSYLSSPSKPVQLGVVVRYNKNGTQDSSFGKNGKVFLKKMTNALSVAQQPDGKIVIAGYVDRPTYQTYFVVVRLNITGGFDSSFGKNGMVDYISRQDVNEVRSMVIQPDGKILIAANAIIRHKECINIYRLNSDGSEDDSFGYDGQVTVNLGHKDQKVYSMALEPDGKILVAGTTRFYKEGLNFLLVCCNPDGNIDTAFGNKGYKITDFGYGDVAYSVAVESDGKIIVGGTSKNHQDSGVILARYSENGNIDKTFGVAGKIIAKIGDSSEVNSVAVQPNGRIIAAVRERINSGYEFSIVGYTSNGTLDESFGRNGISTTSFGNNDDVSKAIAIDKDGSLFVSGYSFNGGDFDFAVAKYDSSGASDPTFGKNGTVTSSFGKSSTESRCMKIQPDGKIVIGGGSYGGQYERFALARYNLNGSLDTSFGNAGEAVHYAPDEYGFGLVIACMALQPDGKILVAGSTYNTEDFVELIRFNKDGTIDSSFGNQGMDTTHFEINNSGIADELILQTAGKILLSSVALFTPSLKNNVMISRFNPDGSKDNAFSTNGKLILNLNDYHAPIALQSDGKIIVGLTSDSTNPTFNVLRLNADGMIDSSFGINGFVNTSIGTWGSVVNKIKVDKNDKILAVGGAGLDSGYYIALVRYLNNGNLDSSFGKNGVELSSLSGLASDGVLQSDGKIVVANTFQDASHTLIFQMDRFDDQGEPDSSFGYNGSIITTFSNNNEGIFAPTLGLEPNGQIVSNASFFYSYTVERYKTDLSLGIVTLSEANNYAFVYPNPVHEYVTLKYTLNELEDITIDLLDVNGKLVRTFLANQNQTRGSYSEQLIFDPSLPSGIYFLTIGNGKQKETVKIIKQ